MIYNVPSLFGTLSKQMQNIDATVSTFSLQDRYGITKTTLYRRLGDLGIEPYRKGTYSFVTPDDVQVLDRLNQWILEGGNSKTFEKPVRIPRADIVPAISQEKDEILILIEAISRHFANRSTDPIASQKALVYLADNLIIVPTSKVRELIGCKPKGDIFGWGSFVFERCGRIGRETAWKVQRLTS